MSDLIGKTIDGRFRVDSFIAAGGMGAVYRGTQLSVDRAVAVKVILDNHCAPDEIVLERFFREAQCISQLTHPNIVGLIDFGRDEALTYLVMEFVAGVSLSSLIETQPSNPEFVVETMRQISEALAEAHANGLVHRDLKPDNILVVTNASGAVQVKVVDFGIARLQEYETISDSGAVIGTPSYMSPEQAQDLPVDGRSDLFTLGIIAYEMMTGRLPFEATEPLQTMMKICNSPLPPLDQALEEPRKWPQDLVDLVSRLLEKSPEARVQSASELLAKLRSISIDNDLNVPRVSTASDLRAVAGPVDSPLAPNTINSEEQSYEPTLETDTRGNAMIWILGVCILASIVVIFVISAESDLGPKRKTIAADPREAARSFHDGRPASIAAPTSTIQPIEKVADEKQPIAPVEPLPEAVTVEPSVIAKETRPTRSKKASKKKEGKAVEKTKTGEADPLAEKLKWLKKRRD